MSQSTLDSDASRRAFLQRAGSLILGAGLLEASSEVRSEVQGAHLVTPSGKPLRGLYPIVETPFTQDDRLDTQALAAEVDFINRGRVNGMIWPVFASSWSTLSEAERLEGAETILAAGKRGKSAIAIAVQNSQWDVTTSVRYAKHAESYGADAIVAIPPNNGWNVDDQAIIDYYKVIGAATDLPLIVQTRGTMSVELMLRMFQQIPTMKATKDEVGNPLERVAPLIQGTGNKLAVWAAGGGTGTQLLEELPAGFVGLCPTPQFADLLQQVQELYWAGKKREAFDMYGRVQAFATIHGAVEYTMVARGVFKETTRQRQQPMEPEAKRPAGGGGVGGGPAATGPGAGGGIRPTQPLTDEQKQIIRDALTSYLKPYLRA